MGIHFRKYSATFLLSSACYLLLAYFINRNESALLLGSICILFVAYFIILKNHKKLNFNVLFIFGLIFRLLFIFSTPTLSDDFYRFIWDGNLLAHGINPFRFLPMEILKNGLIENSYANQYLLQQMNSPGYYSVYPPMMQFVFFIGSKLSFGSQMIAIILMRIIIVAAEIGTFFYLKKLLVLLQLNPMKTFIYWLNPLVIIELTGNIHFEGIMVFFVVAAFYYLLQNKLEWSALFFALAVSTKMIPLILLPIIVNKLGIKKGLIYATIATVATGILFSGFIDIQLIKNISNSIELYFQTFEFNASVYYLLRFIGYQFYGYNLIGTIGKILPFISLIIILYISFKKKYCENNKEKLFAESISILFVYYLSALIVHPWYITFLLVFSIFANHTFVIVWSGLVFLTYTSYSTIPYHENMYCIFLEYAIVLAIYFLNTRGKLLQSEIFKF